MVENLQYQAWEADRAYISSTRGTGCVTSEKLLNLSDLSFLPRKLGVTTNEILCVDVSSRAPGLWESSINTFYLFNHLYNFSIGLRLFNSPAWFLPHLAFHCIFLFSTSFDEITPRVYCPESGDDRRN